MEGANLARVGVQITVAGPVDSAVLYIKHITGRCISYSAGRVEKFNMFDKIDKNKAMIKPVENPWVFIVLCIGVFSLVSMGFEAILFNGDILRNGITGAVTGILFAGMYLSYLQWREEE